MTPAPAPLRSRRPPRAGRSRGIALLVVLGMLIFFAAVIASQTLLARLARVGAGVHVERSACRYAAESALADALWEVLNQRRSGATAPTPAGTSPGSGNAAANPTPWIADGRPRQQTNADFRLDLRVLDANSGLNLGGPLPGTRLRRLLAQGGGDADTALDSFLDSLDDYADTDNLARLHGHEKDAYRNDGVPGLPRNAHILCRDEIYWLPHLHALPGALVTPLGAVPPLANFVPIGPYPAVANPPRPSFYTIPLPLLQALANLEDADLQRVAEARQAYYDAGSSVQDSLGDLYGRLTPCVSFGATALCTFDIRARTADGQVQRRLEATLDVTRLTGPGLYKYLTWWEYACY